MSSGPVVDQEFREKVVEALKGDLDRHISPLPPGEAAKDALLDDLARRLELMAFGAITHAEYKLLHPDFGPQYFTVWAALHGFAGCLRGRGRLLQELGLRSTEEACSDGDPDICAAEAAAHRGHEDCLRALSELGETDLLINGNRDANGTPAHHAAQHGHVSCLRFLHEVGATFTESAYHSDGQLPAHWAAISGSVESLAVLHELGAATTLSAADETGGTPAHVAAEAGQLESLVKLHELGARLDMPDVAGKVPAHGAAHSEECLRVLAKLGARMDVPDLQGKVPAHDAAHSEGCLRVLAELGVATSFCAVAKAEPYEFRAHEFPGVSVQNFLMTPAHAAVTSTAAIWQKAGIVRCLRVLHEELCKVLEPQIAQLRALSLASPQALSLAEELSAHKTLSWTSHKAPFDQVRFEIRREAQDLITTNVNGYWKAASPVVFVARLLAQDSERLSSCRKELSAEVVRDLEREAAESAYKFLSQIGVAELVRNLEREVADSASAYKFLSQIGGAKAFEAELRRQPDLLHNDFSCLLDEPDLLELNTKQEWLVHRLAQKADEASGDQLVLVVRRDNMLDGVCEQLGVQEATGQVDAQAQGLTVMFDGEMAEGDGLRREWLGAISSEILDPQRGLFVSSDGGRTLQPNPHSATTHGPDHLSHFALLGRLAGLALYHRELLHLPLTEPCLKSLLGQDVTFDDLKSVDPELHEQLSRLRDMPVDDLAGLGLTFTIDATEALVYDAADKRRRCDVELIPRGEQIEVTANNLEEFLSLRAKHLLVEAIAPQLKAIRDGLSVFVDEPLRATLRRCCTPAEFQLMLCGAHDIDVDDWQASCEYAAGYTETSQQVLWFWALVRRMSTEERGKLLHFCTGSVRAPATGFATLRGFHGAQNRFRISRDDRGVDLLPTAATCFNTLRLPPYENAAVLEGKLHLALTTAAGFEERAVAE